MFGIEPGFWERLGGQFGMTPGPTVSSSYPGVDPVQEPSFLSKNWPLIASLGGTALESVYGPNDYDLALASVGKAVRGVGQSALMQRNMNAAKKSKEDFNTQLGDVIASLNKVQGVAANTDNQFSGATLKKDGFQLKFDPFGQELGTNQPNINPSPTSQLPSIKPLTPGIGPSDVPPDVPGTMSGGTSASSVAQALSPTSTPNYGGNDLRRLFPF